ncbi:hypothetical protein [Archangium lipolyticum]|uniref:hypothetical protein n=1 Tax=Archangium lipolyticum TaxID=2970465 RepID=UPI00214A1670|nr:hypothetical protein [Archangium lipolyticum]
MSTDSAAASVKPPRNIEHCAMTVRSAGSSRFHDQSMAPHSVHCRAEPSRRPPRSNSKRRDSRS